MAFCGNFCSFELGLIKSFRISDDGGMMGGSANFQKKAHRTFDTINSWPPIKNSYFEARFTMLSGFQPKILNSHGEHELELAANRAEPENQAELVPGPEPDQKIKFLICFDACHKERYK